MYIAPIGDLIRLVERVKYRKVPRQRPARGFGTIIHRRFLWYFDTEQVNVSASLLALEHLGHI